MLLFDVINTTADEKKCVASKFAFDKTGCLLFSIPSVGTELIYMLAVSDRNSRKIKKDRNAFL